MANMLHTYLGATVVTVHTRQPPSDAEWGAYVADILALNDPAQYRVLVYSEGGGPNARQRSQLSEALRGAQTRTAIVTGSVAMRGIGTIVSWFNNQLKVFGPGDLGKALGYLSLSHDEQVRVLALLRSSADKLGMSLPPVTLSDRAA